MDVSLFPDLSVHTGPWMSPFNTVPRHSPAGGGEEQGRATLMGGTRVMSAPPLAVPALLTGDVGKGTPRSCCGSRRLRSRRGCRQHAHLWGALWGDGCCR